MHQTVTGPGKWHECHACDVGWRGPDPCFLCGKPGVVHPLILIKSSCTTPDAALGAGFGEVVA